MTDLTNTMRKKMKLFMRNFYTESSDLQEIKDPLEYEWICMTCASKMGGKMDRWAHTNWHYNECSCCKLKREVTEPKNYLWRN